MKRGAIWILLICLMVTSLVLASCSQLTTTTTNAPTSTSATVAQTTAPTSIALSTTTTTATTTTATGNWWDTLPKPQYGGLLTLRLTKNLANFDPANSELPFTVMSGWMEDLYAENWTLNPAIFNFRIGFYPSEYAEGLLAKSWEFPSPGNIVFHLRQGIHWQDKPPANGRGFIASDIVFHYDRLFGLGDGFTKPAVYWSTVAVWRQLSSVTATDNYTVVFTWNTPNPEFIMETMQGMGTTGGNCIENPESVQQWGDLNDWHHALGTGPFILQDFVDSSSVTMVKNPNYWGYDERYPQNRLPYVDTVKLLIIPDVSTALAAMRTGKIDVLEGNTLQVAQQFQKTNPDILQLKLPTNAQDVNPRIDVKPFSDIRVREAMQMAIDLPTIAKSYYGGTADPYPLALTSYYMTGYGFPYDQWPQDLKDEYAYNPTVAKQLLAAAGYTNGFNTNIVADSSGDLNLLQIVQSSFAAVGINMDIRTMDPTSWIAFVMTNHKHDQLAYRSLGDDGSTSDPFHQLGRFYSNTSANFEMIDDPVFNAFYNNAVASTSVDGVKQQLRDANEYFVRHHWVISLLQPNLFAFYQPWLNGYNGQYGGAAPNNAAGASLIGFYPARFWIDQNLKK